MVCELLGAAQEIGGLIESARAISTRGADLAPVVADLRLFGEDLVEAVGLLDEDVTEVVALAEEDRL